MSRPHPRAEVVEEVEHFTGCGYSPAQIATRLDMTPAAINRALYRAGQPELARMFNPLVAEPVTPCADCGQPGRRRAGQRCVRCASFRRERAAHARRWGTAA